MPQLEKQPNQEQIPTSPESSLENEIDAAFENIKKQPVSLNELLKESPESAEIIAQNNEAAVVVVNKRQELVDSLNSGNSISVPEGYNGLRTGAVLEALAKLKRKDPEKQSDEVDIWDAEASRMESKMRRVGT